MFCIWFSKTTCRFIRYRTKFFQLFIARILTHECQPIYLNIELWKRSKSNNFWRNKVHVDLILMRLLWKNEIIKQCRNFLSKKTIAEHLVITCCNYSVTTHLYSLSRMIRASTVASIWNKLQRTRRNFRCYSVSTTESTMR